MQEFDNQLSNKFRLGMRRLVSGVAVITAHNHEEKFAMTASSITSLSDEPPSLLVCVNKSASIQSVLAEGHPFAVSILNYEQQVISDNCAKKGEARERFSVGSWVEDDEFHLPYLRDALAVFLCKVDGSPYEYGTHKIVIGRLEDAILTEQKINPLVYLDGAYCSID